VNSELEVLQDAVGRLERAGIAYMLTGSIAMSYYAQPRMTRDIDLVVELDEGDAKRISDLFHPDYYVSADDADRAVRMRGMFNLLHMEKLVKLDLIVRKDEDYRRHEFGRRVRARLHGFDAWIVVWAKPSMSEFQLRDVRSLLATGADTAYLRRWAAELSVADLLEENLDAGHDA
jgi:hypothetical protein